MPNSYGLVFVDKCNKLIHEEGEMHMPNSYVEVFVDRNNELIHPRLSDFHIGLLSEMEQFDEFDWLTRLTKP